MAPTRVNKRGQLTRERLRTAARESFADLGWTARVQDIAERAGVSHGTFYTYYDNRQAVLVDLVTDTMAAFIELASGPWEGEDAREALEKIIGGFLDTYQADAGVMRTWLQASREDPEFGALYLELRQRFTDRITEQLVVVVASAGREGAGPEPHAVAGALAAMVEHSAYLRFVLGAGLPHPVSRQTLLDSLMLVWTSTLNSLAGYEVIVVGPR